MDNELVPGVTRKKKMGHIDCGQLCGIFKDAELIVHTYQKPQTTTPLTTPELNLVSDT